jgi:hypothetical protein
MLPSEWLSGESFWWITLLAGPRFEGEDVLKSFLSFGQVEEPEDGKEMAFYWMGCSEGDEEFPSASIRSLG